MKFTQLAILISITSIIALSACNNAKEENDQQATSPKEGSVTPVSKDSIPALGSLNGDTINVYGKFVLFYGPAKEQNDTTVAEFKATTNVIIDSLKKAGDLNVAYTTVTNIRVFHRSGKAMIISTAGFDTDKGVMVMDGLQPPSIKKGMASVQDYHQFIKKYFLRP